MTGQPDEPVLDYRDGFRAEYVEDLKGNVGVYLELLAGGLSVVEPVKVAEAQQQDWREVVAVRRQYLLYKALCRCMNAGGTQEELGKVLADFVQFCETSPSMSLPPGTEVLDVMEESSHQVLYVDEDDIVTVVTEDQWVDCMPLTHLAGRIPGVPVEPFHDGQTGL